MTALEATAAGASAQGFDAYLAEQMVDPEFRAHYERSTRTIQTIQQILRAIEEQRRRCGLSKAEVARRAGIHPVVLRRLLTSDASNPTLTTVLDVLDVLGVRLHLEAAVPSVSDVPAPAEGSRAVGRRPRRRASVAQ